jgi:DNA-binding beta-propeller fold protein YncE
MKTLAVSVLISVVFLGIAAPVQADATPLFVTAWGSRGRDNGRFEAPWGIAIGPDGRVYVSDRFNHQVKVFTATGVFITEWGSLGDSDGQLAWPTGIGVAPDGRVYVVNTMSSRVQVFTPDGAFLAKFGSMGGGAGQLQFPFGLAVGPDGRVFVADTDNNRIQVFASDGTFLATWGSGGSSNGQFDTPYGVAVAPNGHLYVADTANSRIQVFTADGTFLTKWNSRGYSIAVAPDGTVYVVDYDNNRIQAFTAGGTFLTQWGSAGTGNGQFTRPAGVACDSRGEVYVTDPGNYRVQKFGFGKPGFPTVADVPNDQGRLARIRFPSSSFDALGPPRTIVQYEAYRRVGPSSAAASRADAAHGGEGTPISSTAMLKDWEFAGAIPAHGELEYSMVVPTLCDSTDQGVCWSAFFIRAATPDPLEFYDSRPDSGYSVDNLAPSAPLNFDIASDGFLHWDPSPEEDLRCYTVYASQREQFDATAFVVIRTTDTKLNVTTRTYPYYYLTATDIAGNESEVTTTKVRPVTAAGAMPPLTVSLRVAPNPFNPSTTISYAVPFAGPVTLAVYDVTGHFVAKLIDREFHEANTYQFTYRPSVATGVYFLRLTVGNEVTTKRIVLLK